MISYKDAPVLHSIYSCCFVFIDFEKEGFKI